jgi:hypothetical protein
MMGESASTIKITPGAGGLKAAFATARAGEESAVGAVAIGAPGPAVVAMANAAGEGSPKGSEKTASEGRKSADSRLGSDGLTPGERKLLRDKTNPGDLMELPEDRTTPPPEAFEPANPLAQDIPRVKPRKGTLEKVTANQPRDPATGEMIDPYSRKPLDPEQTDLGHVKGQEWWRRKEMHQERGSTRSEVIEAENDPKLYQWEDRPSNQSHQNEKK